MKALLAIFTLGAALAQEKAPAPAVGAPPEKHEAHEAEEGPSAFEAEFVASSIFRSGSYIQPLWRGLGFEGHYFGGETTDVGYTGAVWTFRVKELKLSPGFGVMFGSDQFRTSPTFSFRWDYERAWFVTQGLVLQGFRETPVFEEGEGHEHSEHPVPVSFVTPKINDGSHVSARWKRVTLGGTWEHIHFREGDEWKGGGRLAFRLLSRVSAILYVLGPGRTEWRAGVLFHPKERD